MVFLGVVIGISCCVDGLGRARGASASGQHRRSPGPPSTAGCSTEKYKSGVSKRAIVERRVNMPAHASRMKPPTRTTEETIMTKQIFINLPVRDLPQAKAFYEAIGAVNNPQFTDETAACMVLSDSIFVMLLTYPKWAFFTRKPIV